MSEYKRKKTKSKPRHGAKSAQVEKGRVLWSGLEADIEFFEQEISALTIAIPLSALDELMQGPSKFIKIGHKEILNLFQIKIENPETPSHDAAKIKSFLALAPAEL